MLIRIKRFVAGAMNFSVRTFVAFSGAGLCNVLQNFSSVICFFAVNFAVVMFVPRVLD